MIKKSSKPPPSVEENPTSSCLARFEGFKKILNNSDKLKRQDAQCEKKSNKFVEGNSSEKYSLGQTLLLSYQSMPNPCKAIKSKFPEKSITIQCEKTLQTMNT